MFRGRTADDAWKAAHSDLLQNGVKGDSRAGMTLEVMHAMFEVEDPFQRWVLSREPAINPAFAIAEVIWIMQGRDDSAFLNFWNPALPKFAGAGAAYHGAYGHRLRKNLGFDQFDAVYDRVMSGSEDETLSIFDSSRDLPHSDGTPRAPDIPCNVMSSLKVRNGKLHWLQVMRSNDLYLGTPHNFVQFMSLHEIFAGWFGLEVGPYVHIADSLHVYERMMGKFGGGLTSVPENTDRLALPKDETEEVVRTIGGAMDVLRYHGLRRSDFPIIAGIRLPTAWRNMFKIVAADAARRHGWHDEMAEAAEGCANPVLRLAWSRWLDRVAVERGEA